MGNVISDDFLGTYEETYKGYEIYIDRNRDSNRGGFEWTVCKDESEYENGLSFTAQGSLDEAFEVINILVKNPEPII